jgi:sigma-E factor negative regulatory protein RseA
MKSVSMQSQVLSRAERLSAVLDGEPVVGLEESLRDLLGGFDEADRTIWSDYHLIGDALRSDDLAASPAAGQAFMARFSARLADEPHLLAPAALASANGHGNGRAALLRRRVLPAFAVAAAAATLTWVVVPQLQGIDAGGAAPLQPSASADAGLRRVALTPAPVANMAAPVQEANIIRDARLDQYLEAHQQFAQQPMFSGSMPLVRAAVSSEGK